MLSNPPLILPGLLFLVTVVFGFWVSRSDRPYQPLQFNLHKLAALAGVVLLVIRVRDSFSLADFSGWVAFAAVGATLSGLILFVTGGVMSVRGEGSGLALFLHRAGPVIIALSLAVWILLF